MPLCHFIVFEQEDTNRVHRLAPDALALLQDFLRATPGLAEARVHLPGHAHDPMLHDGLPPPLALQLYFSSIEALESAMAPDGHLQGLAGQAAVKALGAAPASQQAMLVRRFTAAGGEVRTRLPQPHCTYQVTYAGPAQDSNAWLWHYLSGHAPLMARLPGVRQVEVCTRIDWCGFLPWPRADHLQRNQVVFDDEASLDAALQSPLRAEMREHFMRMPPFSGSVTHFPMQSLQLIPDGVPASLPR